MTKLEDELKEQYVREIRAIVWNDARIQSLQFLYESQRLELMKMTNRTAGYKIAIMKLFVKLMRLTEKQ